jgi:hypothetical protein
VGRRRWSGAGVGGRGPASKAGALASRPGDLLKRASWQWAGAKAAEPTGRQPPWGHGPTSLGCLRWRDGWRSKAAPGGDSANLGKLDTRRGGKAGQRR